MKKLIKILTILLCLIIPYIGVEAASSLIITYNNKTYTYKDKQVKVVVNGKDISISNTPGILKNQTVLLPYEDIFANSSIGAKCTYKSSTNTITIIKDAITINMTLNSKIAYVNGKKVTMSTAPLKVKYKSVNINKILVPAKFVAESLGCTYTWNNSTSTSTIHKPLNIYYDNKWTAYLGAQTKLTIDGKNVNLLSMPGIIVNNTTLVQAKKAFATSSIGAEYKYNSKTKIVTLNKGTTTIKLTIDSKTAYVNDKKVTLSTAPKIIKNKLNGNNYVMVPAQFVATNLGYNYIWNNSTITSVITTNTKPQSPSEDTLSGTDSDNLGSTNSNAFFTWGLNSSLFTEYTTILNLLDQTTIVANADSMNNPIEVGKSDANNTLSDTQIDINVPETEEISENITDSETGEISENTTEITEPSSEAEMPSQSYIYTVLKTGSYYNTEVYTIESDLPMTLVTASNSEEKTLLVDIVDAYVVEQDYVFDGGITDFIKSENVDNNTARFTFNLNTKKVKYQAVLSEDNCTLTITIYNNIISTITAGTQSNIDYITISGIFKPTYSLTESGDSLYIDLPYAINGVGEQIANISQSKNIKSVESVSLSSNMTRIIVNKNANVDYYIAQNSNSLTINFTGNNSINTSDYDIKIPKPQGINYSMLTITDLYLSKKIKITIPGNFMEFYNQNPIQVINDVTKSIQVTLNSSGNTDIIFTTSVVKGFKVGELNSSFTLLIRSPKEIYKNIVVLDPGHGGTAVGATYSGIYEKDINFKILYTYAYKYFENDPNIKAYYIRTTDVDMSLYDRAAFAKSVEADLFISLHNNAAGSSAKGTEIYYSTENNKKAVNGLSSSILANIFANNLPSKVGTFNRGVKTAGFVVTKYNTVPAILIELAFMTNSSDMSKLKDDTFLRNSAKAIYDITATVFKQYPTGR